MSTFRLSSPVEAKANVQCSKLMLSYGVIRRMSYFTRSWNHHCWSYRQQMIKLDRAIKDQRPQYDGKHDKVTLHHDNARTHVTKTVQETLQVLNWEILLPRYIFQTLLHLTTTCFDPRGTLQFLQKSHKMGWPMDCFKGTRYFLSRNPFVAWIVFSMDSILNKIYFILLFRFLLYFL